MTDDVTNTNETVVGQTVTTGAITTETVVTTEKIVTKEHTETEHFTLQYWYPAHEARKGSAASKVFEKTKKRMHETGNLRCWIDNADCGGGPLELHHALVEHSLIEAVSVKHFMELYPEFALEDEASFTAWCQSEGNLLCLCPQHHRGVLGIHTVHYSAWVVQRFLKEGAIAPERGVRG